MIYENCQKLHKTPAKVHKKNELCKYPCVFFAEKFVSFKKK